MDIKKIRILYMGTPEISAYVLESLILEGYNIVGLIAQPDKPVGRKGELAFVPTKKVAIKYNIPVYQIAKIRKEFDFVNDIKPDLILTLAYGQIIPQGLIDIPKFGCLNLHGSLLPKYRGAAPIQYALINNDKVTGMTLMEMTKDMDAGKMYAKKEVIIDENDNCSSLFNKMGVAAKELALSSLQDYIDGKLIGEIQNENLVSIAPMIKPDEEKISLLDNIDKIYGYIRALSDAPGAYLFLDDLKLKIFIAKIVDYSVDSEIGTITQANKSGLIIQCKDGHLNLLEIQKEGKKRMDYKSFINGNQNLAGKILH